jgi:probable F420-dependent oxidoreductase
MSRPFRFAVQGGPFADRDALAAHARMVEDLGYQELFTADHLGTVDPFLPLLIVAEHTTMLRMGPLVLNNGFHHPAMLARTAATFDALSGGRLVLGLGTGYMRAEHDATGIALHTAGARVDRLGETLAALRTLLDTGSCRMHGEYHDLAVEEIVRPVQPSVPFLIGGQGRRVVTTVAAPFADIFQFTGLTHDPVTGVPGPGGFARPDVRARRDWLRAAAGERFDAIELSTLVQATRIGADAPAEREAVAERLGCPPDLVDESPFALVGTEDAVVEKLLGLREDLGISHVVVRHARGFAPIVDRLSGT